jgi:hypothetical protein
VLYHRAEATVLMGSLRVTRVTRTDWLAAGSLFLKPPRLDLRNILDSPSVCLLNWAKFKILEYIKRQPFVSAPAGSADGSERLNNRKY